MRESGPLRMAAKKSKEAQALGNAIRALRRERGYNQEVLAERSRIDRSYFGCIERGEVNISVELLVRIAEGLEASVSLVCAKARL